MKEIARQQLEVMFLAYVDAVNATRQDAELIGIAYNKLEGAIDLYEKLFNEAVYYRVNRGIYYEGEAVGEEF
jgi:hypothetical protein